MSIPLRGLVAAYPLNNNALDVSGRGHNGTMMSVTSTQNRFCTNDAALFFDGSRSILTVLSRVTMTSASTPPGTCRYPRGFAPKERRRRQKANCCSRIRKEPAMCTGWERVTDMVRTAIRTDFPHFSNSF
jgi:hypothetical protein